MPTERIRAASHRILQLAQKLRDDKYRHSFLGAHIRQFLARQMRAFRGDRSQDEFAALLGTSQTIVSRLEDPAYGKWTVRTLLKIAAKMDVALIVRFVDYKTFLAFTDDVSDEAADPKSYDEISTLAFARLFTTQKMIADKSHSILFGVAPAQEWSTYRYGNMQAQNLSTFGNFFDIDKVHQKSEQFPTQTKDVAEQLEAIPDFAIIKGASTSLPALKAGTSVLSSGLNALTLTAQR